jgi:hypothetical protein
MSLTEGKKMLAEAKRAGVAYAGSQIDSEQNQSFGQEIWRTVEQNPIALCGAKGAAQRYRAADSILTDLSLDVSRNTTAHEALSDTDCWGVSQAGSSGYMHSRYGVDLSDCMTAFRDGVHKVLRAKTTISWLADELKFQAENMEDIWSDELPRCQQIRRARDR